MTCHSDWLSATSRLYLPPSRWSSRWCSVFGFQRPILASSQPLCMPWPLCLSVSSSLQVAAQARRSLVRGWLWRFSQAFLALERLSACRFWPLLRCLLVTASSQWHCRWLSAILSLASRQSPLGPSSGTASPPRKRIIHFATLPTN